MRRLIAPAAAFAMMTALTTGAAQTRLTSWGEKVWIDAPAGKYVMGVDDAFDYAVKPNVIGLIDLGG
ncbi:hypothetical protein [Herbidospora yilanensis]|uniref:hypothetical protein n=1 Tax=Herbidospora yilanensis TaxID=354426 RepID=UPI000A54EC41|nr:hypothetical protein [Herbidospora yilanensis]